MVAILFFACTKTVVEQTTGTPQVTADPKALIEEFLSEVGHEVWAEDRSVEDISVDSAVWYVEAALNWSLTASERQFNDVIPDTLYINVAMDGGLVSAASLQSEYGSLHTAVMGYTTDDQHVSLVDVEAESVGATEVVLRVVSFVCSGYERDNAPSATYASNDWRKFGLGGPGPTPACVCGSQPAQAVRCMDKEIEYRINAANPLGSGYAFINVVTWTITPSPTNLATRNYKYNDPFLANPNDPGNDECDESLTCWWHNAFGFCVDAICASPARQSYWTTSTWAASTKIRQQHCYSKHFKICTMGSTQPYIIGDLEPYNIHTASFSYGDKILK